MGMRPHRSLLKFRLPYTDGVTQYLGGELRLPVWGPQTTTECRLLVKCEGGESLSMEVYDHQRISEQLFYFNTVTRISIYPRPQSSEECGHVIDATLLAAGLCRCYDCSVEVAIISAYLHSRRLGTPSIGAAWASAV